ncbi:MAG: response regulator transcription factor [Leptolyngbyaceae cyanobacterium MO_188.B28]|nr:response regulator transcription factor [Leptolyngbyaceae cyanobacterium MO_188.B28]
MIRILLVDDQAILRQALKALLEKVSDFQVVGTASDGQAAIEQVAAKRPDVVLLDIQMPVMDGLTASWLISQRFADTKVIVLSGHDDNAYLARALKAGAKGYLLKNTGAKDLADTIRNVHRGYGQFGPGLLEKMAAGMGSSGNSASQNESSELPELPLPEPEFRHVLNGFDAEELLTTVQQVTEQETASALLAHLEEHLKQDPNSLAALYLSGALSHRENCPKTTTLSYLRVGFKEGLKQGISQDKLMLFYREAAVLEPQEAFTWVVREGGPWDNKAGISFLLQEATEIFGPESEQRHTLQNLWRIKAMFQLKEGVASINSKITDLQQGFERLSQVVQLGGIQQ